MVRQGDGAKALDSSALSSFSSALSAFRGTIRAADKRVPIASSGDHDAHDDGSSGGSTASLQLDGYLFVTLTRGPVMLVAQSPVTDGRSLVGSRLSLVWKMFVFLRGDPSGSAEGEHSLSATASATSSITAGVSAVEDVIKYVFLGGSPDNVAVAAGVRHAVVPEKTREKLDRTLQLLEDNDNIHGALLSIGSSVLHSRASEAETRMITLYLAARPLGAVKMRTTPIYTDNQWTELVVLRFQSLTLATITSTVMDAAELAAMLDTFVEALQVAALRLPVDEPPVLLRHYAGHDTVTFLFQHNRSGSAVSPQLSTEDMDGAKRAADAFTWLLRYGGDASDGATLNDSAANTFRFEIVECHRTASAGFPSALLWRHTLPTEPCRMLSPRILIVFSS